MVVDRDVGGPQVSLTVTSLGDLDPTTVDMRRLLLVSSSQTRVAAAGQVHTSPSYPDRPSAG